MKNKKSVSRRKTIKGKILLSVIPVIVIGMAMLMALSLRITKASTVTALEKSMHETALAATKTMHKK